MGNEFQTPRPQRSTAVAERESLFTEAEMETLILAIEEGTERRCSEEEIKRFIAWCEIVRFDASLLNLILAKKVLPIWDDGADCPAFVERAAVEPTKLVNDRDMPTK
jgi:hypothetical protein